MIWTFLDTYKPQFGIRNSCFFCLKTVSTKAPKRIIFRVFIIENQTDNDKTILYETYQQIYGNLLYCR